MTGKDVLNDFFEYNLSYTSYDPDCTWPENEFELKLVFNEIQREMAANPWSDYHMVCAGMSFGEFKVLVDSEYRKWLAA